jgi:hypothetical protein
MAIAQQHMAMLETENIQTSIYTKGAALDKSKASTNSCCALAGSIEEDKRGEMRCEDMANRDRMVHDF